MLAFAVHVAMTSVVALEVVRLIDGRTYATGDRGRPSTGPERHLEGRTPKPALSEKSEA